MFLLRIFKHRRFLPLLAVPLVVWLLPLLPQNKVSGLSADQVNLALRRTADALLRQSGDSTSRVPTIEHTDRYVWRVWLEQPFDYDQLPNLLQSSLDLYNIRQPYEVVIRRCDDAIIELGYHQRDVTQDKNVPCSGREMPEGCHFIEVAFTGLDAPSYAAWNIWAGIGLMLLGAALAVWWQHRSKPKPQPNDVQWLTFGQSRLDVEGQILICNGTKQHLTFRETKLLRLFATHSGQLLERENILQQVWADEGILVGRSIDMFVSRLRKKLAADSSIAIVAVHGVGYRLETA
jgi:hypothetical protein